MPMALEKDRKRRTDKSNDDGSDSEKDKRSKMPRVATRDEETNGKGETRHHRRDATSPDREAKYSRSRHRDERRKEYHESRQRSRSRDRTDRSSSRRTDKHSVQDHGRSNDRDRREREDRSPHLRRDRSPSERDGRPRESHRREERAKDKDSSNYGLRQNSKRIEEDGKARAIKQEPSSDAESDRQDRHKRRERNRDSNRTNIFKDDETAGMSYGKPKEEPKEDEADKPLPPKVKPDFGLSGKLAEETNVCNGVVVKYSEPPEARRPKRRWRFYVFKGDEPLPTLYLHRQSAFLIGRDRKVADMPIDHPSCSKQHAVLQFRLVNYDRPDGTVGRTVRPYIIDLGSSNGTFLNNQKIEAKRYVEVMEKDVLKFGFSSREYVLLHEDSKDEAAADDLGAEAGAGDGD